MQTVKCRFFSLTHAIILTTVICLFTVAPVLASGEATPAKNILNVDIRTLTAQVGGSDTTARTSAMALLKAGGQSTMPDLLRIGRDGTVVERRGAIIAMASLPLAPLGTDEFITALSDEDVAIRSLAAHALAIVGPSAARQTAQLLGSENQNARSAAAYALKLMGKYSVPALIETLSSNDVFARSKAAWLLGRMGKAATPAIPPLVAALQSDDTRVMHIVAEAIDLIGANPAIVFQQLTLIGHTPDCPVRRIGTNAAPTLVRLLSRPGTMLAQLAFRALSEIGTDAQPALLEAIRNGSPSQRTAAALLLVDIDPDMVLTLPEDLRTSLAGATR